MTGTFQLDQSVGTKTGLVLQTPITGTFTATVINPSGSQVILSSASGSTNWNDFVSTVGVTSLFVDGVAVSIIVHSLRKCCLNLIVCNSPVTWNMELFHSL